MSEDNGCPYMNLAESYLQGAEEEIRTVLDLPHSHSPQEFYRKAESRSKLIPEEPRFLDPSNLDEVNMRHLIEMARKASSQSEDPTALAGRIDSTEAKVNFIFGKEE